MTRDEMISALWGLGFKSQSTASKKWKTAFLYSTDQKTMVVLVRTRGCDVLITNLRREDMTGSEGFLTISSLRQGDSFVEYFYTNSNVDLHTQVYAAAEAFAQGRDIDPEFYKGAGIGRQEWGRKYGDKGKESNGILYEQTTDADRVRYVEYETDDGKKKFEFLIPQAIIGNERLRELSADLKSVKIKNLAVKTGLCWAEYISIDGYNTHELLTAEFDESKPGSMGEFTNSSGYTVRVPHDGYTLSKLKSDIEKGHIRRFNIVFGERLPKDYYGDHDYSMYPGGYGPAQALGAD